MLTLNNNEITPKPQGELVLRSLANRQSANVYGDIGAAWVVEQMEYATQIIINKFKTEKIATVAISQLDFISPIRIGEQIDIYAKIIQTGNSSVHINIEVWRKANVDKKYHKVTDGTFVVVSLTADGRIKTDTSFIRS